MFRTFWPRWRRDQRGLSDYIELAMVLPMVLAAFVAGSAVVRVVSGNGALHTVAGIADRSLVANGCLTPAAVQGIETTLQAAHMSPSSLSLVPQGLSSSQPALYGTTGIGVQLAYPMPLTLPFVGTVSMARLTAQVSNDQSQAVAYNSGVGCASSAQTAVFAGTAPSGGVVSLPPSASGITVDVNPNPDVQGSPVTIQGTVSDASGSMANAAVTIAVGDQTLSATANANGQYATSWTPNTAGTVSITAASGSVQKSDTLTVQPPSPASVTLVAPSPVSVGQPFAITGTVFTTSGQAVANGTTVTVSSSDSSAFPSLSATTQGGNFTVSEPAFTALSPSSVTFTGTAGSATGSVSVAVAPGAPQAVTLTAKPASGPAGSSWTVSGTVTGPDGTPVTAGTPVSLASANDAQDTFPMLSTAANGTFSGSVMLTPVGSVTLTATAGTVQSPPLTVSVTPSTPAQAINLAANPNPVNQGATTILTGTVVDAYGNPVASGTALTLSSTAWSTPVSATTGKTGALSAPVVFNQAGSQIVSVAWNGKTLGTLTVKVNQLGAYTIKATQPSTTLTAGQSQTVTFTLTNSTGQPVAGDTLNLSANPSSATLSAASEITNAQGQVTVTVSPTKSGTLVVTASLLQDNGNTTGTAAWQVQPASPDSVDPPTISPSVVESTQDGGTQIPVVTGLALDPYGNPIANASVAITGGWDPGVTATGTANAEGYFSIPIQPVAVGGPYHPTITVSDSAGSNTQTYTNTSLTVVQHLYTITLQPTNGSGTTPAGTPYGITATLLDVGAPVSNATITFTVTSNDTATTWAANGATPTPTGPTTITVTTNSAGQATVEAAFMPNLGTQTVEASYAMDNTTGTLGVTVTANQPSTADWVNTPNPDPVTAGQPFHVAAVLTDAYGFGLANGEPVTLGFAGLPEQTWDTWSSGYGPGTIGSGAFTPTQAGTYWVVIFNVAGQAYNQSGDPGLPGTVETVNPGPVQYLYPVLGPANNTSNSLLPGGSWNGSTMAYGSLPANDGQTLSLRVTAYDAYGNTVPNWNGGTLSCTDSSGGCGSVVTPPMPTNGSGQSGWQNEGAFSPGSVTLTWTPTGADVAGSPTTTHVTFTVPYPYTVVANNGGTVENVAANPWTSQSGGPAAPPSGFSAPVHALNTWFAAKPGTNGNPNCNSTTMACSPIPGNPPTVDEWTGASWQPDVAVNAQLQSFTFQVQVVAYNTCGYHYGAYYCAEPTVTDGMTVALTGNSSVLSVLTIADPNKAPGDMWSAYSNFYPLIAKGIQQTPGGVAGPWSQSLTTPMPQVGYNGGWSDFYGIPTQDQGTATYDLQQITYGQWSAGGTVQAVGNVMAILTSGGISTQTEGLDTGSSTGTSVYMSEEQLGTSSATSTGMQWTVNQSGCNGGCYGTVLDGSGHEYVQGALIAQGGGYSGSMGSYNYWPDLVHIPLAYNAAKGLVWLLGGTWQHIYQANLATHQVTTNSLPWTAPSGSINGRWTTTVDPVYATLTASQVHAAAAVEVQYEVVTSYCGGVTSRSYVTDAGAWLSSGWTTQGTANAPPIGDWLY